eukprot:3914309-Rhodomonas_salina.1
MEKKHDLSSTCTRNAITRACHTSPRRGFRGSFQTAHGRRVGGTTPFYASLLCDVRYVLCAVRYGHTTTYAMSGTGGGHSFSYALSGTDIAAAAAYAMSSIDTGYVVTKGEVRATDTPVVGPRSKA